MGTSITLFPWLERLTSKQRADDQNKIRIQQIGYNEQLQSVDFIFMFESQ